MTRMYKYNKGVTLQRIPLLNAIRLIRSPIMSENIYTSPEELKKFDITPEHPRTHPDVFADEALDSSSIMLGDRNPMYGMCGPLNPNYNGHPQTQETRDKISKNNARYWEGVTGEDHPSHSREYSCSEETKMKISIANKGKKSWNSGKSGLQSHSDETKRKMSEAKIGKPKRKIKCPHCGKIGGEPQMKQWHFNKCKLKKA